MHSLPSEKISVCYILEVMHVLDERSVNKTVRSLSPLSSHSNGAVCGALMGCKLGFRALPQDLLEFPYREWLDTQVEGFLRTIGLD